MINTIQTYPLFEGQTILHYQEQKEQILAESIINIQQKFERFDSRIKSLEKENETLKIENKEFLKNLKKINLILKEKGIYDFSDY